MGYYWKKCPYCGHTIEAGSARPTKRLGDPNQRCPFCLKVYNDRSVIDWEKASVFRKILYYFANGRFWICLAPSFVSVAVLQARTDWANWMIYLVGFAIFFTIFALCALYVRRQIKHYRLTYEDGAFNKKRESDVNDGKGLCGGQNPDS